MHKHTNTHRDKHNGANINVPCHAQIGAARTDGHSRLPTGRQARKIQKSSALAAHCFHPHPNTADTEGSDGTQRLLRLLEGRRPTQRVVPVLDSDRRWGTLGTVHARVATRLRVVAAGASGAVKPRRTWAVALRCPKSRGTAKPARGTRKRRSVDAELARVAQHGGVSRCRRRPNRAVAKCRGDRRACSRWAVH